LSMRAQEIAEIIAMALEKVPGKRPRIVRDNGSQFAAEWWRDNNPLLSAIVPSEAIK